MKPTNHKMNERVLIKLVHSGEWKVDKQGRIWRLKYRRGNKNMGIQFTDCKPTRLEKKVLKGYLIVRSMINGKRYHNFAHRLVWQFFNGNIPEGLTINHKNGIKHDNKPDNLELMTYSEQQIHSHRVLNNNYQWGENNHQSKLTDRQIKEIRDLYSKGKILQIHLAKKYNVAFQTISKIVRGKRRIKQSGKISNIDHRNFYGKRDKQSGRFLPVN